jgi:hypothetical protein
MAQWACDDCHEEGVRLHTGEDGRDRCDPCLDKWLSGPGNDAWLDRHYSADWPQSTEERYQAAAEMKRRLG